MRFLLLNTRGFLDFGLDLSSSFVVDSFLFVGLFRSLSFLSPFFVSDNGLVDRFPLDGGCFPVLVFVLELAFLEPDCCLPVVFGSSGV